MILLLLIPAIYMTVLHSEPERKIMATWLWDIRQIENNPAEILTFLEDQHVNTLYLQVNPDVPIETYQSRIGQLTDRGIAVHALGGAPYWASSTQEGQKEIAQWMKWIQDYQAVASRDEAFSGIHLDVEPYLHEEWEKHQQEMLENYQDLLVEVKKVSTALEIDFGVDVPFWFYQLSYDTSFGKGNLSEWILENCQWVTIMAYRSQADGPNGIKAISEATMKLAKPNQTKIMIAVETSDQPEKNISFSKSTLQEMDRQLQKVDDQFAAHPAFGGFAIHHLISWMSMNKGF